MFQKLGNDKIVSLIANVTGIELNVFRGFSADYGLLRQEAMACTPIRSGSFLMRTGLGRLQAFKVWIGRLRD